MEKLGRFAQSYPIMLPGGFKWIIFQYYRTLFMFPGRLYEILIDMIFGGKFGKAVPYIYVC